LEPVGRHDEATFREPDGSSGLPQRRDGSSVAFRDPNGSVGFSRRWSRSEVEFVGRPVAPFSGCDAEPAPVGAIFGLLAALLGFLATSSGSVTELFGPVAPVLVLGPVAFVLVLGSVAGIPVSAAKLLVERSRAKLRRRDVAAVRRWRRFARNGRSPRSGWGLARRRPPPLTRPQPLASRSRGPHHDDSALRPAGRL